MKVSNGRRYQLFLDKDLSEKLEALARKPGVSKSTILTDAVKDWLTRQGTQELDQRFGLRLDRLSTQGNRIERHIEVLLESFALYVRYQLTINAPLPEPDQAARAVGMGRFQAFVDQVGRQIAGGKRTLARQSANGDGAERAP